jgi:hypothetical protein
VATKRALDEKIYGYQPLLRPETVAAYESLMDRSFATSRGRELNILLRANVEMYKSELAEWQPQYEEMYVPADQRIRREEFNRLYTNFRSFVLR